MADHLSGIIDRLERADTDTLHTLEYEFLEACFGQCATVVTGDDGCNEWHVGKWSANPHPFYSTDSALTLVPEGWEYQILHTGSLPYVSGKTYCAHIKAPFDGGWHDSPNWTGDANSAPLAICIAALKARMEKA